MVVALGGNAISRPGEEGNVTQQFLNTRQTAVHLADLIEAGCHLVVTHGNGPQVGNVLRRVELAARELYRLPLEICGAHTQGGMSYMIAQCLRNELHKRGIERGVTGIVTSVEVDAADPAFQNPTKPIGSFYQAAEARALQQQHGWQMVEIPQQGFRRVVPSPIPKAIVEIDLIRRLAQQGELLVVAGGGGIPVQRTPAGQYIGVEAVIDKDRTAGLLARAIGATTLLIVTNVDRVAINYRRPNQQLLERMTVSEARRYMADKQFAPGSMGPKVQAAIDFLDGATIDDPCVIICDLQRMALALAGQSGTWIVRDP
ncbi:MAG: carbamate kinase [Phycisphaerae bacterium]|jgi:carbamate kinase